LPDCARCSACVWRCPTQAIDRKRFLLHAEKCLTLFTENPGKLPPVRDRLSGELPCLAGCLICQTICPANQGRLKTEPAPVSFTFAETRHFLAADGNQSGNNRRTDPVWQGIRKKLMILGMLHYQNRILRNLRFIMNSEQPE
jgi:ferredoxin